MRKLSRAPSRLPQFSVVCPFTFIQPKGNQSVPKSPQDVTLYYYNQSSPSEHEYFLLMLQVTGELSNSGQPMRRFMQTFVLVPQAPKQYYVHNDIFRYQDEVFHDNDDDTDPQEESVGM